MSQFFNFHGDLLQCPNNKDNFCSFVSLFAGEYCLGPNIEYIMTTKCGDPLKFMTLWPWEGADCR